MKKTQKHSKKTLTEYTPEEYKKLVYLMSNVLGKHIISINAIGKATHKLSKKKIESLTQTEIDACLCTILEVQKIISHAVSKDFKKLGISLKLKDILDFFMVSYKIKLDKDGPNISEPKTIIQSRKKAEISALYSTIELPNKYMKLFKKSRNELRGFVRKFFPSGTSHVKCKTSTKLGPKHHITKRKTKAVSVVKENVAKENITKETINHYNALLKQNIPDEENNLNINAVMSEGQAEGVYNDNNNFTPKVNKISNMLKKAGVSNEAIERAKTHTHRNNKALSLENVEKSLGK